MKKSTILLLIILIIIIGVALGWYYWPKSEKELLLRGAGQPAVDEADNWKTYKSEEYGFEFRYPTTWKTDVFTLSPFVQLQVTDGEDVISIAGGIHIFNKGNSSSYEEMFVSELKCPEVAGERDLSSPSQSEAYVYCLTGDEIEISAGVWKGAVECSHSSWYAMKEDPNFCPHQFWIDTENFFYVVHFNFFQSIEKGSDEAIFFNKFLKGFSFFAPTN